MSESTSDNLSKFRTKNWVEINDESRGNYANSNIRFKTTMLRSNLCDYADSYILVKGTITVTGAGDDAAARQADERDKGGYIKYVGGEGGRRVFQIFKKIFIPQETIDLNISWPLPSVLVSYLRLTWSSILG